MWVKICGNTDLADAQLAANLGADALGFIFAPSSRQVTAAHVAEITRQLPPAIEKIGVFTTDDPQEIVSLAQEAGLTGVQLHGRFNPALAPAVHRLSQGTLAVIPVLRWKLARSTSTQDPVSRGQVGAELLRQLATLAPEDASTPDPVRLLIDAEADGASGGLGLHFPWESAASALAEGLHPKLELIVAGGLRPENVQAAIQALRPFGVDVASGVESTPGRKDPFRLRDFIQAAHA